MSDKLTHRGPSRSAPTPQQMLQSTSERKTKKKKKLGISVADSFILYKRHATACALIWAIFTCGFVVLNVIVFIQPQWIGQFDGASDDLTPGYIGLYERCELLSEGAELACKGKFNDWSTIDNMPLRAATFFVGVSCLIVWICIFFFILFFLLPSPTVFYLCGSLQLLSALFMFLGCVIFPAGWNDSEISKICGSSTGRYLIGSCRVGWAYILAMVGIFDILFLSILAFVLAARQTDWTQTLIINAFNKNSNKNSNNKNNNTLDTAAGVLHIAATTGREDSDDEMTEAAASKPSMSVRPLSGSTQQPQQQQQQLSRRPSREESFS